jgi:hypothetical protein
MVCVVCPDLTNSSAKGGLRNRNVLSESPFVPPITQVGLFSRIELVVTPQCPHPCLWNSSPL